MAISSSLTTKVGAAGTVTAGGGLVGTYFAWDHINYYEVERKVVNEEVEFEVENKATVDEKDSFVIKVKDNDTTWGSGNDKYSWKCKVIGKKDVISQEDLKIIFDKATGNTKDIRKRLVQACSKNRKADPNVVASSQKISSQVELSPDITADTWIKDLLDTEILNETEKKVLESTTYFTTTPTDSKFPVTITATTGNDGTFKTNGDYSWVCTVSTSSSEQPASSTFEGKLPKQSNDSNNQINKKKLVYACAKDKTIKGKKVEAKFEIPATISSGQESQYIFGS